MWVRCVSVVGGERGCCVRLATALRYVVTRPATVDRLHGGNIGVVDSVSERQRDTVFVWYGISVIIGDVVSVRVIVGHCVGVGIDDARDTIRQRQHVALSVTVK